MVETGCCFRTFILIFLMGGLACSIYTSTDCTFLSRSQFSYGMFREKRLSTGNCETYPDNYDFDASHQTARVCSGIAPGCALLALLYLCLENCCNVCCGKCVEMFLLFVAMICQGLTFLLFNAEVCTSFSTECTLDTASYVSMAAGGAYFVSYCLLCCAPNGPVCGDRIDDD